ncbi:hypothetical protein [Vibrio vulnificus]|uniref:hypothetical protein n=1 Tax=Vibrio vulnificus TaxID=672 RepID=UPI003242939A
MITSALLNKLGRFKSIVAVLFMFYGFVLLNHLFGPFFRVNENAIPMPFSLAQNSIFVFFVFGVAYGCLRALKAPVKAAALLSLIPCICLTWLANRPPSEDMVNKLEQKLSENPEIYQLLIKEDVQLDEYGWTAYRNLTEYVISKTSG